jgi:hypothetical protein
LNDIAQFITPDIIVNKAFHILRQRSASGELRCPDIHVIVAISEAHRIASDNVNIERIPMETIFSDAGNESQMATVLVDLLKREWANFNNSGYEESPVEPRSVFARDPTEPLRITGDDR